MHHAQSSSTHKYRIASILIAGLVTTALPFAGAAETTITQIGDDIVGVQLSRFGDAVALSSDGTSLVVGAAGDEAGFARVLDLDGSTWTQRGDDIIGESPGDYSGYSVAMSADGDTIAVGAIFNTNDRGHVRIYDWDGSTWTQRGTDIDGEAFGDQFGTSVSMSSDGDTVAIGAPYNYGGTDDYAGHVRVFDWDGSTWTQRGTDIDGEAAADESGRSVAMSADGDTVAIGATYNDGSTGFNSGHVRIFDWDGSTWTRRGDDIDGASSESYSAWTIALSSDGNTVAEHGLNKGVTRIFDWDGSTWTQRGSSILYSRGQGPIALAAGGLTIAIGDGFNSDTGPNAGEVRIYDWDGTSWTQRGADLNGSNTSDSLGHSVAMSADSSTLATGANNANGFIGYVRVYAAGSAPTPPTTTTIATTTSTTPTSTTPTSTVPPTVTRPPGATIEPAIITPGATFTVAAPCKKERKVGFKLNEQSRLADCVATTAATGLAEITFDGIATATFTAPTTPGNYTIQVELEDTGISYVIPFTVTSTELPATGSDTTRTGAALAIALLGVGALVTATTRRTRHS